MYHIILGEETIVGYINIDKHKFVKKEIEDKMEAYEEMDEAKVKKDLKKPMPIGK